MPAKEYRLSDEDVRDFIISGFHIVEPTMDTGFHAEVAADIQKANEGQANPRSGIVQSVPSLQQVYADPAVHGALESLLGADYEMHPYTLSHCNPAGYHGIYWHQGSTRERTYEPTRLMVFYFPEDITTDMGPSMIAPGTQYRKTTNAELARYQHFTNEIAVVGKAGAVLIMHYDLWHRGSANHSAQSRLMVKTVFQRTQKAKIPSWNVSKDSLNPDFLTTFRTRRILIDNETDAYRHQDIWLEVWFWLHGKTYRDDDWFPKYIP